MNIHPFDEYDFDADISEEDNTTTNQIEEQKNFPKKKRTKKTNPNITFVPTVMGKKIRDTPSNTESSNTDTSDGEEEREEELEQKKKEQKKKAAAKKKNNKKTDPKRGKTTSTPKKSTGKGKGKASLKNKNLEATITADLKSKIKGTSKELLDLIIDY